MTIFTSKDPAGRTAMELGAIFTGLAIGGMNAHEKGMQAVRAAREDNRVRVEYHELAKAQAHADRLGQIAKSQAAEIVRLRAQVAELQAACSQRHAVIERLMGRG